MTREMDLSKRAQENYRFNSLHQADGIRRQFAASGGYSVGSLEES